MVRARDGRSVCFCTFFAGSGGPGPVPGRTAVWNPVRVTAGLLLLAVFLSACTGPAVHPFPPSRGAPTRSVYVVAQGWHAGIVFRRADIPAAVWPESGDFSGATYIEVGWGDEDYYRRAFTSGRLMKAAFWPTPSVLHIVGFDVPVETFFRSGEIIRLDLSVSGYEALSDFMHRSYARDATGNAVRLGPGIYRNSTFYLSRERYHLFNTCNVWTARALQSAGIPIGALLTFSTESLMSQLRPYGVVIRPGKAQWREELE